jgi:hypothetical protein
MAHRGIASLKKLLQAKVRRPPAPPGLANLISRILPTAGVAWSRRLSLAAAAVLVLGLGAVLFLLSTGTSRLAHANVVASCLGEFLKMIREDYIARRAPGVEWSGSQAIIADIRQKTSVDLDGVPAIPGARYAGCSPHTICGVKGARLDFLPEDPTAAQSEAICVFILPLDRLDFPACLQENLADGHCCRCVRLAGNTIFCLTTSRYFFTRPAICLRKASV